MVRNVLIALLSAFLAVANVAGGAPSRSRHFSPDGESGTVQKMMVTSGTVTIDLDVDRITAKRTGSDQRIPMALKYNVESSAFFRALVFNDDLRGLLPGAIRLVPVDDTILPVTVNAESPQFVLEASGSVEDYELVIRDARSGLLFFNLEGQQFAYISAERRLTITGARLRLSKDYAAIIGRAADAGTVVGKLAFNGTLQPVEIAQVVNGEIKAETLPAVRAPEDGMVPGPDVVIGDLFGLAQFGTNGTQVGLALGTDSCNFGTENVHWFTPPNSDHPVIPQNLYRMSGGSTNDERFEQIGQSSVLHAFFALAQNTCSLGCNNVSGTNLGSGCSNPYTASIGSGPNIGSRAWINPFTGEFPNGTSGPNPNDHAGHVHNGTSHRILTESNDLLPSANPGATYYAEAQEVTPHEYAWCQANPGQCNMYNNVSYRRYSVTGTSTFTFTPVGATVRAQLALSAWTGATAVQFQPDAANDGVGTIAYKVTNPSAGVWHYEYAVYNQNLDRAIQSLGLPVGPGVTVSNLGFHAPPQHPGWGADGTAGNAGYSGMPWSTTQVGGVLTWSSETLAQNPNANAIRWGTLYNFRFDSNRPPQNVAATIGFFKTGAPITVTVQGPAAANVSVTGRVWTPEGIPLRGAIVVMTDVNGGNARVATTSSFGYFNFDNVVPGVSYTFTVSTKRYIFNPVTVPVNDNISSFDIVASGTPGRTNQ